MRDSVTQYRCYADGTFVHQDDFNETDHAQPYYDDYETITIPDALLDHLEELFSTTIPEAGS